MIDSIPKKVTVICLGNTCRSPTAEFLLRKYAAVKGGPKLSEIEFDSAGLGGGFLGLDPYSYKFLRSKGVDPSEFRSKKTDRKYLDEYDLVLIMEESMRDEIIDDYYPELEGEELEELKKNIIVFREMAGEEGDIQDPYGMEWYSYKRIMVEIDEISEKIIEEMSKI